MITKEEISRIADMKHLPIRNAEKDYILEILLYLSSDFSRKLVFKGGTALYKFYNLNRFSEDIDFTLSSKRFDIDSMINKIVRGLSYLGMHHTITEKIEYGNEITIRLNVRGPLYDGSKNSMSRVTINISRREKPILMEEKMLIPSYQEIPSFRINILSPGEIAAEKIRCILTRDKPRDIYDLWFLLKRGVSIDKDIISRKLRIYNLSFDLKTFYDKIWKKKDMWTRDLRGLIIGSLPDFREIVDEIESILEDRIK